MTRVLSTVAALACVTCVSFAVSAQDRYEARPLQNLDEATAAEKSAPELTKAHRFQVPKSLKGTVPDLQTGCGEGYHTESMDETAKRRPTRSLHDERQIAIGKIFSNGKNDDDEESEGVRKARSYYYRIQTPASVISVWRPPVYRLQRPYYIPIFGAEGEIPIYFPPQPLFINPGFPVDNPPRRGYLPSSKPEPYLPPGGEDTTAPAEPDLINNRFGEDYPVWDRTPIRTTSRPPTFAKDVPTRRPARPRTTFPPLVHKDETAVNTDFSNRDGSRREQQFVANRNVFADTVNTTPKPSSCVWAIINCCSAGSSDVNHACFERFACPGPFWDSSPCDSNFAKLAIESATNYFQDK